MLGKLQIIFVTWGRKRSRVSFAIEGQIIGNFKLKMFEICNQCS